MLSPDLLEYHWESHLNSSILQCMFHYLFQVLFPDMLDYLQESHLLFHKLVCIEVAPFSVNTDFRVFKVSDLVFA